MSLADLPAELIAHVTSYLNYDEIRNLMETSKKNYNAINIDDGTATGAGFYDGQTFIFKGNDLGDTKVDNILHMFDTCWSINEVYCDKIDDDFCKAMIQTETDIGWVSSDGGSVTATPSNFISLCEKVKKVCLFNPVISKALLCDEVFIKCMDSMYLEYEPNEHHVSLGITDRTLEAYAEKNKSYIDLFGVTTSFTIEGIVKALQVVEDRGEKVSWFLGVLLPGQADSAEFYFNKDTGKLRNKFDIEIENDDHFHRIRYTLTTTANDGHSSSNYIFFEVSEL